MLLEVGSCKMSTVQPSQEAIPVNFFSASTILQVSADFSTKDGSLGEKCYN